MSRAFFHRMLIVILLTLAPLQSVPANSNPFPTADTITGDTHDERLRELEAEVDKLEKKLHEIEQQMDQYHGERRAASNVPSNLDGINADPKSVENILRPAKDGWASERVYSPDVALVEGQRYLLFGTRGNYPGEQGIGYVPLTNNGLKNGSKRKLVTRGGHHYTRDPELVPSEFFRTSEGKNAGGTQLYATDYYLYRLGEWSSYITRRNVTKQGERLEVSGPTTVLTGNDQRGHWMGRSVSMPSFVRDPSSSRLYFRGKTYPNRSDTRKFSISSLSLESDSTISSPLLDPGSGDTIWNQIIGGFDVIPLTKNRHLVFVVHYLPNDTDQLRVLLYDKNRVMARKTLLTSSSLKEHLPESTIYENLNVEIFNGIEIARFDDRFFGYISVELNDTHHAIYRFPVEFSDPYNPRLKSRAHLKSLEHQSP